MTILEKVIKIREAVNSLDEKDDINNPVFRKNFATIVANITGIMTLADTIGQLILKDPASKILRGALSPFPPIYTLGFFGISLKNARRELTRPQTITERKKKALPWLDEVIGKLNRCTVEDVKKFAELLTRIANIL